MSKGKQAVLVYGSQLLFVVLILGAWQLIGSMGSGVLPPLSDVVATLKTLLGQSTFRGDLAVTALEVLVCFAVTVPLGLLIGFVIGERPALYRAFRGPLDLLMATPKALFLPLFIFAFGIGFSEKVMFAMSLGIFVVILNGIAAVHSVPVGLIRAARSMGATRTQLYLRIYLPGMLPLILQSMRLGLIFTIFGVLVAEMYGSARGLGQAIFVAGESYHLKEMLAEVLLVMIASIVLSEILRQAETAVARRRKGY